MKILFIFLLCLAACSTKNEHAAQDKEKIELLFQNLMLDNYFAYTLFGTKPVSLYCKFHESSIKGLIKPNLDDLFFQYWKIWKKSSINTPNYAFIEYDDGDFFSLILVNKKNLLNIVKKHLIVFHNHFQRAITPEEVLEKILNTKSYFDEFGNNEVIYGILFGFGYTNSLAFHLKNEKEHFYLEGLSFHEEPRFPLYRMPLPFFMVFYSNDEIFELRKTYEEDRRKILDIYSHGDFLQITLDKLTSPRI